MAHLLSGYLPERIRRADQLTRTVASAVDILRLGPNVSLRALLAPLVEFCATGPRDSRSQRKAVLLDLDGVRTAAQNALLRILEEPPGDVVFVLTASELPSVLPTIRSRCMVEVLRPSTYGTVLRDLTLSGMSVSAAAQAASRVLQGHSVELLPDDLSMGRARTFIQEASAQHVGQVFRLAVDFDSRTVVALRVALLETRHLQEVEASYRANDPEAVALLVADAIIKGKR